MLITCGTEQRVVSASGAGMADGPMTLVAAVKRKGLPFQLSGLRKQLDEEQRAPPRRVGFDQT